MHEIFYILLFYYVLEIKDVFYTNSTTQFELATFQGLIATYGQWLVYWMGNFLTSFIYSFVQQILMCQAWF